MLNEKFGTITTLLHLQNGDSKTPADSKDDEFIDGPIEIDFVQRKEPITNVITVKYKIKRLVIPVDTVDFRSSQVCLTPSLVSWHRPLRWAQ